VRALLHEHHRPRNRACPVRHTGLVIGILVVAVAFGFALMALAIYLDEKGR
jgi:hypothetical protein